MQIVEHTPTKLYEPTGSKKCATCYNNCTYKDNIFESRLQERTVCSQWMSMWQRRSIDKVLGRVNS